jgi:hypothetical protein
MADNVIGTAQIDVVVDASQAKKGLSDVQSSVDKLKGPFRDVVGLTDQLAGGLNKSAQQATKLGAEMLGAFGAGGPAALGIAAVGASIALWVKYFQDAEKARRVLIDGIKANQGIITSSAVELTAQLDKLEMALLSAEDLRKRTFEQVRNQAQFNVQKFGEELGKEMAALEKGMPTGLRKDDGTEAWLQERDKAIAESNQRIIRLRSQFEGALGDLTRSSSIEMRTNAKIAKEEAEKALGKPKTSTGTKREGPEGAENLLVVDWIAADKELMKAEADSFDQKIDRRVERMEREITLEEEANQYKIDAYKKYLDELAYMQQQEEAQHAEFNRTTANMFIDGFASGVGQVTQALIEQGELTGPAMKKIAAGVIEGVAIQASVKGAFEIAEGIAALAGVVTAPLAAGHFLAAGKYFAVAALAGGTAAALGAGASGPSGRGSGIGTFGAGKKKEDNKDEINSRAAKSASRRQAVDVGQTVNIIVGGSIFSTKEDVGAAVYEALRAYDALNPS